MVVKHAAIVTTTEEDMSWKPAVLGVGDPLQVQRAVFYYVSKVLCSKVGQEQRDLKVSQFVCSSNPDC